MTTDARIEATCGGCKVKISVKAALAGKRVACPKCGTEVEVANPSISKTKAPLATDRQKEYAASLGIEFRDDITRPEISKLIDRVAKQKEEERFKRLTELEYREYLASEADSENPRLSNATPAQMVESLSRQGFAAVLIRLPWDQIEDFSNLEGVDAKIVSCDDMSTDDVKAVLWAIASNYAFPELAERMRSLTSKIDSLDI